MSDAYDLSAEDIRDALGANHPDAQPQPLPGAQGSAEWFAARRGHATASRFRDAIDRKKNGEQSAKCAAYRAELVIERITGRSIEHFVSGPMRDGIEREPLAKMAYEARTGRMLTDSGFIKHPTLAMVGGSPDALVGANGGIEIKCPTPTVHLETLLVGMDDVHLPQVQGLMWITGAAWWDFVSFCPHFDEPLRLYVQRIPRLDDYIATLEAGIRTFLAEVAADVEAVRAVAAQMAERKRRQSTVATTSAKKAA